jgi:hypothetical protein
MAFRTSLLPQVNNTVDEVNGLANLGFTLTNPQAWANADYLKAKTAAEQQQVPYLQSETSKNLAQGDLYTAQTKDIVRKQGAQDQFGKSYVQSHPGVDPSLGDYITLMAQMGGDPGALNKAADAAVGGRYLTSSPQITEMGGRVAGMLRGDGLPTLNTAVTPDRQTQLEFAKPVNVPGMLPRMLPGDPRAGGAVNGNPLPVQGGNSNPIAVPFSGAATPPQTYTSAPLPPVGGTPASAAPDASQGGVAGLFQTPQVNPTAQSKYSLPTGSEVSQTSQRLAENDWLKKHDPSANLNNIQTLREMLEADQQKNNQPSEGMIGQVSSWINGIGSTPNQEFLKKQNQLQLTGGLGGSVSGQMTDLKTGIAGNATPNLGMNRAARMALEMGQMAKETQALEANQFIKDSLSAGRPLSVAQSIVSEYARDPRASHIAHTKSGASYADPQISFSDWLKEKQAAEIAAQAQANGGRTSILPPTQSQQPSVDDLLKKYQ